MRSRLLWGQLLGDRQVPDSGAFRPTAGDPGVRLRDVQDAVMDGQQVCIDHDHNHCKTEKRSFGECVRGLL
jgi:hypothetical protein